MDLGTIRSDQELPDWSFDWQDGITGTTYDFSSGWTMTAGIALRTAPLTILLTIPNSQITKAATSPNVIVARTAANMATLTSYDVDYIVFLVATRTADSETRRFRPGGEPTFRLLQAPA